MNKLSTWLLDKFREWEREQGSRQSVIEFARYLDVSQPSLARWMAGDVIPKGENIKKLANKLGTEIYEILGMKTLEADEEKLIHLYRSIPPGDTKAFMEWAEEYLIKHGFRRVE